MERQRTTIPTSSDVTTGKTILITKILLASAALTVGLTGPQMIETKEAPEIQPLPVIPYEASWKCEDCSPNEKYVLEQLQKQTKISDRNALATIMGNIKQESKFIPDICEGGARVSYSNCHSGGYGLIQWTSLGRYNNLGKFCDKYGLSLIHISEPTRPY